MTRVDSGFTFRVQMLGLCLFVENKAPAGDPGHRFAVVLPSLTGDRQFGGSHHARFIYNPAHLQGATSQARRLKTLGLIRESVEFSLYDPAGRALAPTGVTVSLPQSVKLKEIAGYEGGFNVDLFSDPPDFHVMSRSIFRHGTVREEPGASEWRVPQFDGSSENRNLPVYVVWEVKGVGRVDVHFEPFTDSVGPLNSDLKFAAEAGEIVSTTLTSDCQLVEANFVLWPRQTAEVPDEDFAVHYNSIVPTLLPKVAARSLNGTLPVPVRLMPTSIFSGCLPALFLAPLFLVGRGLALLLPALLWKFVQTGGPIVIDPSGQLKVGSGGGGSDCQNCLAEPMDFT